MLRSTVSPMLLLPILFLGGCEVGLGPDGETGQGVISGTITDTANVMIPNVSVAIRGAATRNVGTTIGAYIATQLPAGAYTVTVIPPQNYEVAANTNGTVPVEIVGSETKTVNFRLRRTTTNSQTEPPQARE